MTSVEILGIITSLAGGLALFLFGMDTMSNSLRRMAGGLLGKFTDFISKNRLTAFLFGSVVTAIVQSSSAITVMSVGLVNAGIIELERAVGLLIGANLGTTVTSWVLSLNALGDKSLLMTLMKPSTFSPFLAIIAVAIYMFSKNQVAKTTSMAILGFSVMMIGMNMMSVGVSPLKEVPALKTMLVRFSNPILGFGFSLLFTMLIQSSDASIGIAQAFALSIGLPFGSAIPLICGAQVGTCVTGLISSLGASNNGKRTAFVNLYYNLLKVVPFMVVFYILDAVFDFGFVDSHVGAIGIPMVHTFINVIGSLIWLPGEAFIVMLSRKTIPLDREEKEVQENTLVMLDRIFLSNPRYALEQTEKAVMLLAEAVRNAYYACIHAAKFSESKDEIVTLCKRADMYQNQLSAYLLDISKGIIPGAVAPKHALLASATTAFGQINTITMRILEKDEYLQDEKPEGAEKFLNEVRVFGEAIQEILDITILGLEVKEPTLYTTIQVYHEQISRLSTKMLLKHITAMHKEGYTNENKAIVSGLFYTEEQLVDACDIIADALVKYTAATGGRISASDEVIEQNRKKIRALFEDKYELLGLK